MVFDKKRFIHHNQPFLYQYHKPKIDLFLKQYPKLKHYLENIENLLPKGIFKNSERISQIAKETPTKVGDRPRDAPCGVVGRTFSAGKWPSPAIGLVGVSDRNNKANVVGVSESNKNFKLTQKQNYATKLADIALQITEDNKQRHQIIENFMLKNDTATIATEIPVYLNQENNKITGHIDILQIRYSKLHILDFKPEKINKEEATTQLYLYAKALSNLTKIPLKHFRCAFFNNKNYFEFCPIQTTEDKFPYPFRKVRSQ